MTELVRLFSLLLLLLPWSALAGPFGFNASMTKSQVIALVGPSHVTQSSVAEVIILTTAPVASAWE